MCDWIGCCINKSQFSDFIFPYCKTFYASTKPTNKRWLTGRKTKNRDALASNYYSSVFIYRDDLKPSTQCIWLFDYLTWQAVRHASLPGFALLNVSVTAINLLSVSCRTLLSIALVFFSFHVSAKWLSKALQKQAHTRNTFAGHTVIRLNGQSTLLLWTEHKSSVMACHTSIWNKILLCIWLIAIFGNG